MTAEERSRSLLGNEARGGDTAEGGFSFQEAVIMASIPEWLAHDGFTMCTRESMLDAEVAFFVPLIGLRRDGIEAKNFSVTPAKFWEEIDQFQRIHCAHPETYQWFTFSCTGFSEAICPLVNSLRRVRDPFKFYGPESSVAEASFAAYVEVVKGLGKSEAEAHFLFERVLLDGKWTPDGNGAEAAFKHRLQERFPEFAEYPASCARRAWQEVLALIKLRKNATVFRWEIEQAIDVVRPQAAPRYATWTHLHTARDNSASPEGAIVFEWAEFFGGSDRTYPAPDRWRRLVEELESTRTWIREYRRPRNIRLSGERRLSATFAFGSTFSAVEGFTVTMEHRGTEWSTAAHPTSQTQEPNLEEQLTQGVGSELVVSIGVLRRVRNDVVSFSATTHLHTAPAIHLFVPTVIETPDYANALAVAIKERVAKAVCATGARTVHLFYGGPSYLALFLGHRWNTAPAIQCYEWCGVDRYAPSCLLAQR